MHEPCGAIFYIPAYYIVKVNSHNTFQYLASNRISSYLVINSGKRRPTKQGDTTMTTQPIASPTPAQTLLNPNNHTLMLIDHQSQMAFATKSIDATNLRNNTGLIAAAAKSFNVPTILTTVAEKSFSGPLFDEITDVFQGTLAIDRTTMNAWEDANVTDKVNEYAKSKIVFAGLWTSVCIVGPALSAIEQGFEVYVVADASGDVSDEAHNRAMDRMVQAGVRPITSVQYLLELQRDWARATTYASTTGIARKYGGAYGIGLAYAQTMFGGHEG